jgi:hypothetical protein
LNYFKHFGITWSFNKDFKSACLFINLKESYVIENIATIISIFKTNCREIEMNDENELIVNCLQNNQEHIMINQLNFLTYAGSACKIKIHVNYLSLFHRF